MSRRLTAKQEAFCQRIADGKTQVDAYLSAYDWKGKKAGSEKKACELAALPAVAARITQLRERASTSRTLLRVEKREMLADTARGTKALTDVQMKAIEIDNKMAGHNEPEKLKVEGMGSLLQKIRRTAPKP